MLRINLLPPSVTQRRLSAKLTQGFAALFGILVGLLLAYHLLLQLPQKSHWDQQATAAQQGKAKTDSYRQQASQISGQVAPLKAKVDFAHQVRDYNIQQTQLYYNLAKYTDPDVTYMSAAYAGNQMLIDAYAPSVGVLGRYLQRIHEEPDFTQVSVNYVPDFKDAHLYATFYDGKLISISDNPRGSFISNLGGYPDTINYQGHRINLGGSVKAAPSPALANQPGAPSGAPGGIPGAPAYPANPAYPGTYPGAGGPSGLQGANAVTGGAVKGNGTIPGVANFPAPGPSPVPLKPYPTIRGDESGNFTITQNDADSEQAKRQFGGAEIPKDGVPRRLPILPVGRVIGSTMNPLAPPDAFGQSLQQSLRHWRVKRINRGFVFQITATLKAPLTPPKAPGT